VLVLLSWVLFVVIRDQADQNQDPVQDKRPSLGTAQEKTGKTRKVNHPNINSRNESLGENDIRALFTALDRVEEQDYHRLQDALILASQQPPARHGIGLSVSLHFSSVLFETIHRMDERDELILSFELNAGGEVGRRHHVVRSDHVGHRLAACPRHRQHCKQVTDQRSVPTIRWRSRPH